MAKETQPSVGKGKNNSEKAQGPQQTTIRTDRPGVIVQDRITIYRHSPEGLDAMRENMSRLNPTAVGE